MQTWDGHLHGDRLPVDDRGRAGCVPGRRGRAWRNGEVPDRAASALAEVSLVDRELGFPAVSRWDAVVVDLGRDDVHGDGGRGWGEVVAVGGHIVRELVVLILGGVALAAEAVAERLDA